MQLRECISVQVCVLDDHTRIAVIKPSTGLTIMNMALVHINLLSLTIDIKTLKCNKYRVKQLCLWFYFISMLKHNFTS